MEELLLHCVKTRSLWELLFSLFRVSWVIAGTVKDAILSWKGFLVGNKRRKVWPASPLCLFWTMWNVRNRIVFEDEACALQRMKTSLVLLLWSETKLFIGDGPSNLAGFIDWVCCKYVERFCL